MENDANRAQREFWAGDPGRVWVRLHERIDRMHAEAADLLIDETAPQPGETIHDIGCGAGVTTLRLAEKVAPGGMVTGFDISAPMLAAAAEDARAAGAANVRFVEADAQTHPFVPGAAQAVVSRFGVMFFADPLAAFRNMASSLAPGGRMIFLCWAGPEENPWFTKPMRVARKVLGGIEASDPHAPGPLAFADRERVSALMTAAGLKSVAARVESIALWPPGGLDGAFDLVQQLGPLPRLLRERQPDAALRTALLSGVRDELAAYLKPDGGFSMPGRVNIFTARA